jgi:hypothetical protein
MVMVMIVVVMIVPPLPIFFLLIAVQLAKIPIVSMIVDHPLMVVDGFVIVPAVIVVAVGIVHSVAPRFTTRSYGRSKKSHGQQE